MRQQRWEKRSEDLSGTLWVLPLLFVVGALVLGSTLSQIAIKPGSPLDPVLFRGNAEEARRVLLGVATTVVGVLALVVGLTVVALQVASNRYSPRLLRDFLRDRTASVVLGLFVATFTYNAAGMFTVGIPEGGSPEEYGRLAVTVGLCLLFVCIGALVYFVDHMVHSIQIDEVLTRISATTARAIAKEPVGIGRTSSGAAAVEPRFDPPPWAVELRTQRSGYVQAIYPEFLLPVAVAQDITVRGALSVGDHVVEGMPLAWAWRTSPEQPPPKPEPLQAALLDAVTIGFERTFRQDVALGLQQIVDIALLSMHVFDFYTAVQSANELANLLSKLGRHTLGTETIVDLEGTVRVIIPALDFEDYLELACGQIRRRGAGEPDVSRALVRLLRDVGSVVVTENRKTSVGDQVRLVLATAERSVKEPEDLTLIGSDVQQALSRVEISEGELGPQERGRADGSPVRRAPPDTTAPLPPSELR
jgi:uncharacterized membrane protein